MDKIHFSNDAKRIKYEVLKHVAQLAFSGELEERKDAIPFEIIPGVSPSFRCCVYKERDRELPKVYGEKLCFGLPLQCGHYHGARGVY